jgi:hypothetical protein
MFVPGMKSSQAHAVSVLTGLSNGLFRTNVGIYSGNDVGVSATVKLFNGAVLLGTETVTLGPRSGTQLNGIFQRFGQGSLVTTNAHAVVESDNPAAGLFTYGAVIDNATSDSSFVSGELDIPAPEGPVATATPPPPAATPTPTPPAPAPTATRTPTRTPTSPPSTTVVNLSASQFEWNFDNAGNEITLRVGRTYELHMTADDVQHGFGGIPALGLGGVTLNPGAPSVVRILTPTAGQVGNHSFTCSIECGIGHPFDGVIRIAP